MLEFLIEELIVC